MRSAEHLFFKSMHSQNNNRDGLFKSIALAYAILILHVVLLAGMGLLVFLFGGLVRYLLWIVLFGILVVSVSGYLFYRRLRAEGRSLRDALRSSIFQGRAVEISFMGGMASFRLGAPERPPLIDTDDRNRLKLEDPELTRIREIAALADLLEKNLITPEEFTLAKHRVLGSSVR